MNRDGQSLTGCAIWLGIFAIVWTGFRSKSLSQFFIISAIIIIGLILASWALSAYSKSGFGNSLLAMLYTYMAVIFLYSAGTFLATGDFDKAMGIFQKQPTPPLTTSTQSSVTSAPTQNTKAATVTPNTASPEVRTMPTIPASLEPILEKVLADTTSSNPVSEQFEIWRWITGAILGLQYTAGFYVAIRTHQQHVGRDFIVYGILAALLTFTKPGEWVYSFYLTLSGWGIWGYILIISSILIIGLVGLAYGMVGLHNTIGSIIIGAICSYIIAGFMYRNVQMLQFCITPAIVVMFIVLYTTIYQARYRRYLKFV